MRIAVLITAHNRRELTLTCLERLQKQELPEAYSLDVFLVDDGSTDGTAVAVAERFPQVILLQGDGSLYWNGGMRKAMARATAEGFDAYLLLNDDTFIALDAIERMAEIVGSYPDRRAIAVGMISDPATGEISYGGWTGIDRRVPARVVRTPSDAARCDTFNANCVLIGHGATEALGNLDPRYTHGIGDMDYGLRAAKVGIPMIPCPDVGHCSANDGRGLWVDRTLPLMERWRRLRGPKGLPPKEWYAYCKAHGGPLWFALWAKPYVHFWFDALVRAPRQTKDA